MQNISPKRDVRFFGAYDETRRVGSHLEFPLQVAPSNIMQKVAADQNGNWLVFKNVYSAVKRG
jgi:hypothetical protein